MATKICAFCDTEIAVGRSRAFNCITDKAGDKPVIHTLHKPQCLLNGAYCFVCYCSRCLTSGYSCQTDLKSSKFLLVCKTCQARTHRKCVDLNKECAVCASPFVLASSEVKSWLPTWLMGAPPKDAISKANLGNLNSQIVLAQNTDMTSIRKSDLDLNDLLGSLEFSLNALVSQLKFNKDDLKKYWDADVFSGHGYTMRHIINVMKLTMDDICTIAPSIHELAELQTTGEDLRHLRFAYYHLKKLPEWQMSTLIPMLNFDLDQFTPKLTKTQIDDLVKNRGLTKAFMTSEPQKN